MNEDFRPLSVSVNEAATFLGRMDMIVSGLQAFLSQTSVSWKGESFNNLCREQSNCVNSCKKLEGQVNTLYNIINLIKEHVSDLNSREKLEEENQRLYPDLYWYDSDGDRHTNRSIQRQIRANNQMIEHYNANLRRYVAEIQSLTGVNV